MNKKDTIILLTGCVNPVMVSNLKRLDPIEREKDYINALKFWSQFGFKIVFCECSMYNLLNIKNAIIQYGNIEFLQFNGLEDSQRFGKGYGEMKIIRYAINNSIFLIDASYIIKITGRYKIINFNRIYNNIIRSDHIYDIYISNIGKNLTWVDSRFLIGRKRFFESNLLYFAEEINEFNGIYFEHVLAKALLRAVSEDNMKFSFMPCMPRYFGYYGTQNVKYSNNILKYILKNFLYKYKIFIYKNL